MGQVAGIIGLAQWLKTPPGRYLLAWEQAMLDQVVVDLFGFHAVQLGLPEIDCLQANRMPHRWLVLDKAQPSESGAASEVPGRPKTLRAASLLCDFDALPFDSQSLDLVVLPHTLELARDPHLALREVERVLVPEGRVVIVGLNPGSLWALRQGLGKLGRRVGIGRNRSLFLPREGEFLGHRRLRDWLHLLSFEVEGSRFGCYRPPLRSYKWLRRFEWMERAGERWWPVFGSVYMLTAVKRVRGMRLIGLVRDRSLAAKAPAAAVSTHRAPSPAHVSKSPQK
jgi:SAM-dependent methyltransferase